MHFPGSAGEGRQRLSVTRLEQALKNATKPTAKMKSELDSAKVQLKATSQAFREQGVAVRGAERALQSFGIAGRRGISSSQQAIRNEIAKTIREMRRLDTEAPVSVHPVVGLVPTMRQR